MNFPGWQCSVHIVTYPVFTDLTDLQKIETEFNYLIRLYEQQSPNHELSLALAHPVQKKKKNLLLDVSHMLLFTKFYYCQNTL